MFIVLPPTAKAQDLHFSQVDADPMLLNPAYAGFYNGTGRFGMMYRTQWASVSIPYRTAAMSCEVALWRSASHPSGISLGLSLFDDHAGTLSYGSTSAHLAAAYYTSVGRRANNILSFGLEGGYGQAGFDPSGAEMLDPSETFDQQQVSYPLFATGIAWYWQPDGDLHTKIGFSARNLNRPNISYLQAADVYLERRYSLFARAEWRHWQAMSLMPVVLVQFQGDYRELICGADLKWYLEENGQRELSLRAGLAYRYADAVIANFIIEYNAFLFTFCYDANLSGLSEASRTIGAFEVGLIYRMPQSTKKKRAIKCPVY